MSTCISISVISFNLNKFAYLIDFNVIREIATKSLSLIILCVLLLFLFFVQNKENGYTGNGGTTTKIPTNFPWLHKFTFFFSFVLFINIAIFISILQRFQFKQINIFRRKKNEILFLIATSLNNTKLAYVTLLLLLLRLWLLFCYVNFASSIRLDCLISLLKLYAKVWFNHF